MKFKNQPSAQAKGIQQQPKVAQAKKAQSAPHNAQAAAPQLSRPQPKPDVGQQKRVGQRQATKPGMIPPVYRPQPAPKCLQAKMASAEQLPSSPLNSLPVAASAKRFPYHAAGAEMKRAARELPNKHLRGQPGGAIQRAATAETKSPPPAVVIADSDIVVEDSAKKHEAIFAGGVRRLPTDDDIRRNFKNNMRFEKPKPDAKSLGAFVWDSGSNKMVFKIVNGKYHVFHYHATSYK